MTLSPQEKHLLLVAKSVKTTLTGFKTGAYLEVSTGLTINDLHERACSDRMRLADQFAVSGGRLLRARPPMFRVAVGRYYYSMYHAMRGIAYYHYFGDDYEKHSVLPTKTPGDFPRRAFWENELKDARFKRNEADYDPYPTDDRTFRSSAIHLKTHAALLLDEARNYLRSKGCAHI